MGALKQNLFKAIDFIIRVEDGPDKGKAYRIQPPKITIGRDPRCQITLNDPKVSRTQCSIIFKDQVYCQDLSSRKTTLVNGQPAGKAILRPGDKITFGETTLLFMTRTNEQAKPQLGGQSAPTPDQKEKQKSQKRLQIFLIAIIVLVGAMFLLDQEEEVAAPRQLATKEALLKQIEETNERKALIKENYSSRGNVRKDDYLQNVETHFISGFRDFQNGQYGRALDSFGTTIATDHDHLRAQQYAKTAQKKRHDLIDTHLNDGEKYRDKMMYNRCAAEYEKAIILINDINSKKYELAKTRLDECRLLELGGRQ